MAQIDLTVQQINDLYSQQLEQQKAAVRPSGNLLLGSHLAGGIICRAYLRNNGEIVYIPYGTVPNGEEICITGSFTI